jgi:hypothetical protein
MGKVTENVLASIFSWVKRNVFWWIDIEYITFFCRLVAFWHLLLCIIFIGLTGGQADGRPGLNISRLVTPVTANMGAWIPSGRFNHTFDGGSDAYVSSAMSCPLHSPHSRMGESFYVKPYAINVGEVDTRALIIMFHFLSFAFQMLGAWDGIYYVNELKEGRVHLSHYFEYSVSASTMLIAICAQLGVTDVFLIINIVMNCFSCMILGVIAEVCFDHRENVFIKYHLNNSIHGRISIYWLAHFTAWLVLLAGSIIGALSNLILNFSCINSSGSRIPEWVMGLVFAEMVLFICFGLVQTFSFRSRTKYWDILKDIKNKLSESREKQKGFSIDDLGLSRRNQSQMTYQSANGDDSIGVDGLESRKMETNQLIIDSAVNTEFAYIILSLSAKTILGFGIFMGNLANN